MHKNWFAMARAIALLVFLVSGSWGACLVMDGGGRSAANGCTYGYSGCQETDTTYSCSATNPNTGANLTRNCSVSFGGGTKICIPQDDFTCQYERGTPLMILASFTYLKCDTQCDADSLACVNSGKEWTTIPGGTCNGKGCKISSCTPSDAAWLDSAKAACQSIQGTNDFAIVDTNDVCEHRGHCCALDSLIDGEGCRWRCESQDSLCSLKRGEFQYSVVPDTAVDGSDTTYTGLCYNNCFMHPSKDGRTGSVSGNVTVPDTTAAMASGTYYPDGFEGIRSEYGGLYVYDFLDVSTYEWMDSLLSAPCSSGMYRGIKNGKYVYWKMGDPVPDGVTSVVRIK